MSDAYVHFEKKCPICGKNFVPAPYHSYRSRGRSAALVCSYHCVLESERREEEKRQNAKARKYIKRDQKGVKEK